MARCIESLLQSDYPASHFELICVDNDSTDNTLAVLETYQPRVRVVREPAFGPAPARNAGIRAASGEWIAFTDSDCTVAPDWIRRITAPLHDASVGIVGGKILAQKPCSSVGLFGEIIHDHRRAIEEFDPPYTISMNIAARKETLRALGGFDERFLRCEDVDLSTRAVQSGLRLAYCDEAVIYHRNRNTLAELMREGFQHGYHASLLFEIHDDYYRQAKERKLKQLLPPAVERAQPAISNWRRDLYAKLFRLSKKAGLAIGSRVSRPQQQTCTTSGI